MRRLARLGLALLLVMPAGVMVAHALTARPFTGTLAVGAGPAAIALDSRTGGGFVANYDDWTVSVLDTETGTLSRTIGLPFQPAQVLIDEHTQRAFVFAATGTVGVFNARGGNILDTERFSTANLGDVALDTATDQVYVPTGNEFGPGAITILDGRTGRVVRNVPVGAHPYAVAFDSLTNRAFVSNNTSGTISILDARTGTPLRTVRVGLGPMVPAVDEQTGLVFVPASVDNAVRVLDARTGALRRIVRNLPLPAYTVIDAPARRAFVDSAVPELSTFDARSGAALRTEDAGVEPPTPVAAAHAGDLLVDAQRGRVLMIGTTSNYDRSWPGQGAVTIFDARTGALLCRLAAGAAPIAAALDERTDRLFVVNYMGGGSQSARWLPDWLRSWLPWVPQSAPRLGGGSVTVLDLSGI